MPRASPELASAVSARPPPRRTGDDAGPLVVGLVALHARGGVGLRFPRLLELRAVALGAVAREESAVLADARRDEVFGHLLEDRPPLFTVRAQQRVAAPAFEHRGELPAEIGGILET